MKNLILSLMVSFQVLASLSAFAQGGGMGGHGGDAISQEFFQIGNGLLQQMKKLSKEELGQLPQGFSVDLFETVLNQTKISTVNEELKVDGIRVDAKNFPDQSPPLISVHRASWLQYKTQSLKKEGIVLHEYLGILKAINLQGGEWDEYSISNKILSLLSRQKKSSSLSNQKWIEEISAEFEKSNRNVEGFADPKSTFSCVEYSLLSDSVQPRARKNAYTGSSLKSFIEGLTEIQTDSVYADELRLTSRGDLIVRRTDTETHLPVSLSYCSKLGSKAVQMIRFLNEAIVPIFNLPQTRGYAEYVAKMQNLAKSSAYRNCMAKSDSACLRMVRQMDNIKLDAEASSVTQAKTHLLQINQWLDSLGEVNKYWVNKPILSLFNHYVVHQEYLRSILDLGESTGMRTPYSKPSDDAVGMKNFIESLQNKVPDAYAAAKQIFIYQTAVTEIEFIESFSLKF